MCIKILGYVPIISFSFIAHVFNINILGRIINVSDKDIKRKQY